MLVQALAAYADRHLKKELAEESWEDKALPFLVEVDAAGRFLAVVPRYQTVARGKKNVEVPLPMTVPRSPVPRNSGLHPLLGADDIKYVLGCGAWTAEKDKQNHAERHKAFVELITRAAEATGDEGLIACKRFYEQPDQVEAARAKLADAKPGSLVSLSFEGALAGRPAVREYWTRLYDAASSKRVEGGRRAECLISGRVGPIAPTHPPIKHMAGLGGQSSGVSLMSFDKAAFRSYGWEQNANSPVAPERAMAYVLALNDLLKPGSRQRRDVAGMAFIFWTREPDPFHLVSILDKPTPEEVHALLNVDPRDYVDPNQFYMAGLGANGARLVVYYWISEALPRVKANLKDWFQGLKMVGSERPPSLWHLQSALERDPKDIPPRRALALLRRAIEGPSKPLGMEILAIALGRLRADKTMRMNTSALGLVRMCVNDINFGGEPRMTEGVDEKQNNSAYLCGRLLAVYENLQYASHGEVNSSVIDRYYSLASTNPSVAFPKITDLGKKHLRKLSRDARGARVAIERRLFDLHARIGTEFPGALSLSNQGRFALGYYHERADSFEQARLRKESQQGQNIQGEE